MSFTVLPDHHVLIRPVAWVIRPNKAMLSTAFGSGVVTARSLFQRVSDIIGSYLLDEELSDCL